MAHFIAGCQGDKGKEVTRLGGPPTGISAFARGWNSGVSIYGNVDDEGRDIFEIYADGGSNRKVHARPLGILKRVENELVFQPFEQ